MKNARLYVGNLPFSVTEGELRDFFAPRSLVDVKICADRVAWVKKRSHGRDRAIMTTLPARADALGRRLCSLT